MVVTLDYDIGQGAGLLPCLILELNSLRAEIVRKQGDLIIISRLECECLRNHMLLRKIEGTHRPIQVAFESFNWIAITVLHSVTDITFEEIEHLKELLSDLVNILFFIGFILFTYFFEAIVGAELDLLCVIYSLLLANRSIEIDMLLLECVH